VRPTWYLLRGGVYGQPHVVAVRGREDAARDQSAQRVLHAALERAHQTGSASHKSLSRSALLVLVLLLVLLLLLLLLT